MKNGRYSKEFLARVYETLCTIREFELRCIRLYRQGLIYGYLHPYLGEEAIATGVCASLKKDDYITSTHRGHGHCIARGADLNRMVAEIMGRADGYCHGRGGSMHIADYATGNLGANGIVGGGFAMGVGAAMGAWIRGEDRACAVFLSDGSVNNGTFGESLNLAAAFGLPVIAVVENNQYAVSTPVEETTREPELYKRGIGYGVESHRVDGNDVLEVYECVSRARQTCSEGRGPVLIEAVTYRHGGHHVNDAGLYMPEEKLAYYSDKDPCKVGRGYLIEIGGASAAEVEEIEERVKLNMENAVEYGKASPQPSVEAFLNEERVSQ